MVLGSLSSQLEGNTSREFDLAMYIVYSLARVMCLKIRLLLFTLWVISKNKQAIARMLKMVRSHNVGGIITQALKSLEDQDNLSNTSKTSGLESEAQQRLGHQGPRTSPALPEPPVSHKTSTESTEK